MRKSAHYGLKLPEHDDQYNINDFNDNFTAADLVMHDIDSRLTSTTESLERLDRADKEEHEESTRGIRANREDIEAVRTELNSYKKEMEETISDLTKRLAKTQEEVACPIPVRGVYAQFPQQASPEELWPEAEWQLLNYNGAFFRAQGGNAAAFVDKQGSLVPQAESAPEVKGVINAWSSGSTGAFVPGKIVFFLSGGSSGGTINKTDFSLNAGNPVYGRRDEVAPQNFTIRIWKRTA